MSSGRADSDDEHSSECSENRIEDGWRGIGCDYCRIMGEEEPERHGGLAGTHNDCDCMVPVIYEGEGNEHPTNEEYAMRAHNALRLLEALDDDTYNEIAGTLYEGACKNCGMCSCECCRWCIDEGEYESAPHHTSKECFYNPKYGARNLFMHRLGKQLEEYDEDVAAAFLKKHYDDLAEEYKALGPKKGAKKGAKKGRAKSERLSSII